jgi:VWFA-related protein
MRRVLGSLGLLGLMLLTSVTLPAQEDPAPAGQAGPPVFRTSADLVTVDAVVTDDDGRHVTDLTRDDFEVTVAGKRQDLEQAIYIRTADQPLVLSASRAVAAAPSTGPAAPERSRASLTLKQAGLAPERIARTIALVVDDLGLSFEGTVHVRTALKRYLDTQVQPGDLVAIVRTAGGVGTLQQFTTDRRLLHLAADRVRWDFRSRRPVGFFKVAALETGVGDADDSEAGELRDAMASVGSLGALEYIARGIGELPGRKCIVFFSEGFPEMFRDRGESGRLWRAMSRMLGRANAAGVVVYTIDARGLVAGGLTAEDDPQRVQTGISGTYDAGALVREAAASRRNSLIDSQESMRFIAEQTGGLAIANTNDLNLGLDRVLRDQEGYYLLGYAAPKGASRSGWDQDRVKVRVTRPGLRVRARQGFFGPSDSAEDTGFNFDPLTHAALSPFAASGITVRLSSFFGHDTKDGAYVRSLLFVDPHDLQWDEETPGRHTATFQVNMLAVGDNGRVLAEWRRLVPVALNDEQFRASQERGILYSARTRIKEPGGYQMRAAVRDVNTRTVGSASQYVEVPRVGAGRLALSGVLLKGMEERAERAERAERGRDNYRENSSENYPDPVLQAAGPAGLAEAVLIEPQLRILEPGSEAVYAYEIYDGLKPSAAQGLEMATALLRDGRVVYQSPFAPVTTAPRQGRKVRAIPVAGKLALGPDMPSGPYTLEVIVRGKDAKKRERRQWLDFEVRR